ncbi:putative extracellular conserved serine-rich protein [Phaeoacremonium minimum UCRPA7]|uniref:Putative extracellular conserved serine-rich protein n=1 Tax=Phaeoacremonium minimum (strain UCR-PA7) TaxID=1286976 RepID=R8BEU9_PHAM7|nr:putative extracellular conserved serine-rich protein [Phaeoacremonium minimum UCRPA7]EON97828.1 putative extracellular conserved serine-rich protein [Phaeoacremonium minimum UCRPA7]
MMYKTALAFASFLAAASALQITEPTLNDKLDFSKTNTIKWSSVDTDPDSFEIVLVDHSSSPPSQLTIADSVKTSDNSYSFSNFVAPVGTKYQINFLGNEKTNSGIVAQSQEFAVTKSGVAPTTTTSSGPTATNSQAAASTTSGTNAAVANGPTFGVAGGIIGALLMLI